jgi:4-carboxymuconolactone decarboxylase
MKIAVKTLCGLALALMLWLALSSGYGSRSTLAQQNSAAAQSAEKLPPDIRPDTLSRMPRAKREDFTTEEEKQAFDRIMVLSPKQKTSRWLGETGTRLQIPELAEVYQEQIRMLHEKGGLAPKYAELSIIVGAREANDESAFIAHSADAIKQGVDPKTVEIVRARRDTKGLDPKDAAVIQFGRELFHQPIVSSKTFAEAERQLGRKGTLGMTLLMCYYASAESMLMRAYDQHLDTSPSCLPHNGCASSTGHAW